jgi:aldose 1-epimerase
VIVLERGDLRLELAPEIGGAVTQLTWRGHPLLRPSVAGANHPIQTASFPLVPYVNRIADGVFEFAGQNVHLSRNWEDDAHPLHGQGWLKPWTVSRQTDASITLRFDHPPDEWPWAYSSEQVISLVSERRVRFELSVQNRDSRVMPAGLGFHPAFPAPPDTQLEAPVDGVWLIDDTILPTKHVPATELADLSKGALLANAQGLDHCFTGFKGHAVITWPSAEMQLMISAPNQARWLQLYIPRGKDFFCLEPVTHMPDPFNQPDLAATGIVSLEPGQSYSTRLEMEVTRL